MRVNIGPYPKSNSKEKRTIEVHIDSYDTWNADHTLALIICPVLKKLKEEGHGAPPVQDEDVPAALWSTVEPALREGGADGKWFDRWNYVLDEMIWTFEQLSDDTDFYHEERDQTRIDNGLRLFAKYFQGLWD